MAHSGCISSSRLCRIAMDVQNNKGSRACGKIKKAVP